MAGNAIGIQEVRADGMNISEGSQVGDGDELYVIKKGDTLWGIAKKAHGNGSKFTKIVEVKREVIKDPDLIFLGHKIRTPKHI